jgi:uncharacterized protein (UPF0332 family)
LKDEEIRDLVAYRMEQAEAMLTDVRIVIESERGSNLSVVNRSYYAAFYALLALLQTIGKKSKKHIGAIAIFDMDFVKTGIFNKQLSKYLHNLFDMRQEDDYAERKKVSREEASHAMSMSAVFVKAVRDYLMAEGWLEESHE